MAAHAFPLKVVQDLARFREEAAARAVGLAAARLAEGRQKAEVLRSYREQYARELAEAAARGGLDAARIRDTLAFIARIDDALAQQSLEIERLETHWQASVGEWGDRRRDLRTCDTLEQRHLDRLAAVERRLEQRVTDEWSDRRRAADG